MRKISGKITCSAKNDIPEGSIATVSVMDCGRMDAPSITLGEQIITNPKHFPLRFEIEFDDSFLNLDQSFHGEYALSCRIEKGNKLEFINDTSFNIVQEHETRKLYDTYDFHVIEVK